MILWLIAEFGRRHLETPFSGPRDSDFSAGPDFGPGPVIWLGLDLFTDIKKSTQWL